MNKPTPQHSFDVSQPIRIGSSDLQQLFDHIAQGEAEREHDRVLPYDIIELIRRSRIGALRIPKADGGGGSTVRELLAAVIRLAEADANVAHILRNHYSVVERLLASPPSAQNRKWRDDVAAGAIIGLATTELGSSQVGDIAPATTVTPDGDGYRLNGTKYYSTGTLYADWIDVYAQRADNGRDVIALVNTHQNEVERDDDWDGFGQRLTGSGTTRFHQARVELPHVYDFSERFRYQTAFYQHVLLATLAGIGRAVVRDAAQGVAQRKRIYSHGNAPQVKQDVQVLQVVGQISSWAWAAEAAVDRATHSLQRAFELQLSGADEAQLHAANVLAEVESAQAQAVAVELVTRAATEFFNALGASDTRVSKALDRHWRNARTVSSHNPVIYKLRNVGDWEVNGTDPTFIWQIGNGNGV